MVADSRQTQAISGVSPVQSWERYREDAREAILARLLNTSSARSSGTNGERPSTSQPHGLVRATVLQANGDTEALVDIGGKPYLVNTRQALNPGATVVLRLLDDHTFLQGQGLGKAGGGPLPAGRGGLATDAAGNLVADDKAGRSGDVGTVRGVAPIPMPSRAELKTETGDAKVMLSGSSRLLLALIEEIGGAQRSMPLAPLRIESGTPPAEAARTMRQAVELSGLFYESHLQEWQEGRRRLEALHGEPQAALSPGPRTKTSVEASMPPVPPEPATPEQNAAKGLQAALNAIPADVRSLVQDQIAVLASGRLFLEGAWAERPFTLEIEPDDEQGPDAELPLAWRIRIAVDAPHLGKLQIDIALTGTHAQVAVQPDTKTLRGQRLRDVHAQLMAGGLDLQQALVEQGLHMSDLKIAAASRSPART